MLITLVWSFLVFLNKHVAQWNNQVKKARECLADTKLSSACLFSASQYSD